MKLGASQRECRVGGQLHRARIGLRQPNKPVRKHRKMFSVRMAKDGSLAKSVEERMVSNGPHRFVTELGDPAWVVVRMGVLGPVGKRPHTLDFNTECRTDELQPTTEPEDGGRAAADDFPKPLPLHLVIDVGRCPVAGDEDGTNSMPLNEFWVDILVSGEEAEIAGEIAEAIRDPGASGEKPIGSGPLIGAGVLVVDIEDHLPILHA